MDFQLSDNLTAPAPVLINNTPVQIATVPGVWNGNNMLRTPGGGGIENPGPGGANYFANFAEPLEAVSVYSVGAEYFCPPGDTNRFGCTTILTGDTVVPLEIGELAVSMTLRGYGPATFCQFRASNNDGGIALYEQDVENGSHSFYVEYSPLQQIFRVLIDGEVVFIEPVENSRPVINTKKIEVNMGFQNDGYPANAVMNLITATFGTTIPIPPIPLYPSRQTVKLANFSRFFNPMFPKG